MAKQALLKPTLIALYGFPGSGKSYLARNIASNLAIAHLSADKIRSELFQEPKFSSQENSIVLHLMNYMASEFLSAGVSVIYDTNAMRSVQRKKLSELAKKCGAEYLLVWLQIDAESAFSRLQKRDKRVTDDRVSQNHTRESYGNYLSHMQNPNDEKYLVISGKHSFNSQKSTILSRLYQLGVIKAEAVQSGITRPDLINLVPLYFPDTNDSHRNISVS